MNSTIDRVMVYRAMPQDCAQPLTIRRGDYVTLSRKFAADHAVTSAIYTGENFVVVRVWADRSAIVDALNPGEYRWSAESTRGRASIVADADGNTRRA